jgi:hypothetical protein
VVTSWRGHPRYVALMITGRLVRVSSLVVVLSLVGCAHYRMACPHDGGQRWIEVRSPHFVLRSNVPDAKAKQIVREAEAMLPTFVLAVEYLLPATPDVGPTQLVMFDEFWEYRTVVTSTEVRAGLHELARTVTDDGSGRAYIVMPIDVRSSELFRHELLHRLLHQRVGEVPAWLDEGLAEYYSELSRRDGKLALGPFTARMQRAVQRSRNHDGTPGFAVLSLSELLSSGGLPSALGFGGELVIDGYLSAWALVHYLANGGPDHAGRFRRFLIALADGARPLQALVAEYGDLQQLEKAYRAHTREFFSGKTPQWLVAGEAVPPSTQEPLVRVLGDAEVHELKAKLRKASAPEELKLAQLHEPLSPVVHGWRAREAEGKGDSVAAEYEMDEAVRLTADAVPFKYERARLRLAHALRLPAAARHLDDAASDLRAIVDRLDDTVELETAARVFALTGDVAGGLPLADRAVAREPQCAQCLATLASLLFASGDLTRAVAAQELALRRWPGKQPPPDEVRAQLTIYRCALVRAQHPGAECPATH